MTNAMISGTKHPPAILPLSQLPSSFPLQYAAWLGFSLVAVLVTAVSTASDQVRAGAPIHGWEPYVWELSSWIGYAVAVPALLVLDSRLSHSGGRASGRVLALAAFSLAFSAVHIAVMLGGRSLVYAFVGERYPIGSITGQFAYEYPKDVVPYLMVLGMAFLWRRRALASQAPEPCPPSFLVRERGRQVLVPIHQIDWLEAQGNYVALHVGDRTRMVRRTLRDVEAELSGWGFMRTHRSALVRLAQVHGMGSEDGGSSYVLLANGRRAPLSQGRRQKLKAALAA